MEDRNSKNACDAGILEGCQDVMRCTKGPSEATWPRHGKKPFRLPRHSLDALVLESRPEHAEIPQVSASRYPESLTSSPNLEPGPQRPPGAQDALARLDFV